MHNVVFLDIEDYYFEDTQILYSKSRTRKEVLTLMEQTWEFSKDDIDQVKQYVLNNELGSLKNGIAISRFLNLFREELTRAYLELISL